MIFALSHCLQTSLDVAREPLTASQKIREWNINHAYKEVVKVTFKYLLWYLAQYISFMIRFPNVKKLKLWVRNR